MKSTYIVVSKRIAAASTLSGEAQGFTASDVRELEAQSFTRRVGVFTAAQYQVYGSLSMGGVGVGTDMFFESVPDAFVDLKWSAVQEGEVPLILPRSYLTLYNFGFAQTKNLPKLSEGLISMMQMDFRLRGEGGAERRLKGHVVGFSTRLNTILVPESFMLQSNAELAPHAAAEPTRLIVEVRNPADDAIATFMQQKGYELEDNSLEAGRATYFLKVVAGVVMAVGILISVLSFYILMLSIYLLVQKNAEKLQNLLLIGYTPAQVSLPYQLLTVGLNATVLCLSLCLLFWFRSLYLERLWQIFPALHEGDITQALLSGAALFCSVSLLNGVAIRGKVNKLIKRKRKKK